MNKKGIQRGLVDSGPEHGLILPGGNARKRVAKYIQRADWLAQIDRRKKEGFLFRVQCSTPIATLCSVMLLWRAKEWEKFRRCIEDYIALLRSRRSAKAAYGLKCKK